MRRPDFTENEEKLIAYIRSNTEDTTSILLAYLPWIFLPACLFFYGFFMDEAGCVMTGFLMVFFIGIRFVYYQVKPGWRISPIIDKYEACFEKAETKDTEASKLQTEEDVK